MLVEVLVLRQQKLTVIILELALVAGYYMQMKHGRCVVVGLRSRHDQISDDLMRKSASTTVSLL
jgi:hypothetical protein